jgi:hypothetical protein
VIERGGSHRRLHIRGRGEIGRGCRPDEARQAKQASTLDYKPNHESGGVCLLRPGISDVDLFRYCQGVIYFDAQISDGAFDLRVPEQKLDRHEISRASIDQGRFGASQ